MLVMGYLLVLISLFHSSSLIIYCGVNDVAGMSEDEDLEEPVLGFEVSW